MIRRVRLRRFKRFEDTTFQIPGTVVLAGPNNTGKTTLLQAVAAWSLALSRWQELNNYHRRGGGYERAPIARQAFAAVPLRQFDLLWSLREYEKRGAPIEIEIEDDDWSLTMEFIPDSSEQIYVRPRADYEPEQVKAVELSAVFVPPMTGLGTEEPVYQRPKVDQLLGQARPGEVLRNLLVEAHQNGEAWASLTESIRRLFSFDLLPPDSRGASIVAEYRRGKGPTLDIASAGSGFQQVLMLLAFLYARPASVLLIDEPDAHLHVILQDAIYGELRRVAALQRSQLIMATHSEVIINAADPTEVCVLLGEPRMLAGNTDRRNLINALAVLSHEDVVLAMDAPGILYLEDYTDLQILRAWARMLNHPALDLLTTRLFWKPVVYQPREGAEGVPAKRHYDALTMAQPELPGLQLVDGDAKPEITPTEITGRGLQRVRWRRYEIESYLLHPEALSRFVGRLIGAGSPVVHDADLRRHFEENYPPRFLQDPHGDYVFLNGTKARTDLLPPALTAAGLPGFPYQRYFEIAEVMLPGEIHPEVREKLDAILAAFRQ